MVTSELLTGFLKEAQGYVNELRESLAVYPSTSAAQETLQTMRRGWHTIAGAAEMLELHALAELASPAEDVLEELIASGAPLSEDCQASLAKRLKDVQTCLDDLEPNSNHTVAPSLAQTIQSSALSANILEIFALEAAEHNQVIAVDLEQLKNNPGDRNAISELRRVIHTLKGAAATVGLSDIARVAHQTEDMLDHWLDEKKIPDDEGLALLNDIAEALASPFESGGDNNSVALLSTVDKKLSDALGKSSEPEQTAATGEIIHPGEGKDLRVVADSILRIPQANVDQLVNRVGEVVINRAAIERNVQTLDVLLNDLEYSTRRLQRVAGGLDSQVRTVSADAASTGEAGFDPLEMEQYSLLYQYTRELEEVASDTGNIYSQLRHLTDDLDSSISRGRRLTTELQDGLMETRLVPFREIEIRLQRIVRRTSQDLGKNVELRIVGGDTKVDKAVLVTLTDPLMHLLRNAIDHGIESADTRMHLNKPASGLITLTVSRERGRVIIRLTDDGAGIDLERVRERATELGLIGHSTQHDADDLLNLLFEERFSLAQTVSETSGRGIGLNVVQHAVRQLQGTVGISNHPGIGATFVISVPITLAITRALFVRSGGRVYAVPLEQIARIIRLDPETQMAMREHKVFREKDQALVAYPLGVFGGRNASQMDKVEGYGLVVEQGDQGTLVLVDELQGTHEIVVKSLGTHLRRVHGISGATITGDGSVVLILDLIEIIGGSKRISKQTPSHQPKTPLHNNKSALIVDDSLSVRRVVSMFLESEGWTTLSAKDGVEALEKLNITSVDVALVDIEMPRMNGYELLSTMRADPDLQDIPVVFLTSRSAEKHRERATMLGVDGYLVKPYHEAQLLEELDRVIQDHEQRIRAADFTIPSR